MAYWFDISLKALSTCLIVYVMMIPILKHHNVLNIVDGIAGILVFVVTLIFYQTYRYILFAIIIAVIMILYGVASYIMQKKGRLFFLLLNVRKIHYKEIDSEIDGLCAKEGLDPELIHYHEKFFFFMRILGGDVTALKKVIKGLDEAIRKRFNYSFALRYGVFLIIFIILAILWRY